MKRNCFLFAFIGVLMACTPEESNNGGTYSVHVTGISLDRPTASIKEGESFTLVATVAPAKATNKNVTWSSSSNAVATVDNNGKVTGVKAGSATITATAEDGGMKATCALSVEANLAPSVTVGAEHISAVSAVLSGEANLGSSISTDLKMGIMWSTNSGVLSFNSTKIDATQIEAKPGSNASYTYSVNLAELNPDKTYYYRSYITQNGQDTYGDIKEFTTKNVASMLETKDASDIEATSAKLNAKLDLTDAIYSSKSFGFYWGRSEDALNTYYKCTDIKDNAISATLTNLSHRTQYWYKSYLIVDNQSFYGEVKTFTTDVVPVESVSLDKTEHAFNTIGNTLTLKATVLPADATNKSVEWSSDKEDVATVDQNGTVKAIGNGTATITVTTKDQGKTASCAITVAQWVTGITLNQTTLTLNEGADATLTVTCTPDDADDKSVKWTSSSTSVAIVDNVGKVTAISKGTAAITATANDGSGKTATCSVTVNRLVTSITLNKSSASVYNGKTITLTATVNPSTASDKSVIWSSSDTSVATVSSSGVVTGKTRGTTTITATAKDGSGVKATCNVEVKQYVTSITLSKTSLSLNEGQEHTLSAAVSPDNANDKTYTWSSSDESVATVDQSGKVTAVSKGAATIKASATDGSGKYASCSVTVNRLVSTIQLNKTSLTLYRGSSDVSETLTATVYPSTASNTSVSWTSSNSSVATVSSSGVVTGKARGTTTITATAKDGSGVKATCNVEVNQYVTSITLSRILLYLVIGAEENISVTRVLPDNANDKTYTWSTSDNSIATVDQNGKIIVKAKGSATIKVTANDGSGVFASCAVKVQEPYAAVAGEAVELGLSVKWSSMNLGATSPEGAGRYFAWGETAPRDGYDYSTYEWCNGSLYTLTKYNVDSRYGAVDNMTEFKDYNYEDDAARQALGGKWRIPTDAEWTELREQCTWTWTYQNGAIGRLVTSKANGNSIFLPAAGYSGPSSSNYRCGAYWSSSIDTQSPYIAWIVEFDSDDVRRKGAHRCEGLRVRPVTE